MGGWVGSCLPEGGGGEVEMEGFRGGRDGGGADGGGGGGGEGGRAPVQCQEVHRVG